MNKQIIDFLIKAKQATYKTLKTEDKTGRRRIHVCIIGQIQV